MLIVEWRDQLQSEYEQQHSLYYSRYLNGKYVTTAERSSDMLSSACLRLRCPSGLSAISQQSRHPWRPVYPDSRVVDAATSPNVFARTGLHLAVLPQYSHTATPTQNGRGTAHS
jgi:hypothetical protein